MSTERAEEYLHHSDGAGTVVKDKVALKADVSDAEGSDVKFAAMEEKMKS